MSKLSERVKEYLQELELTQTELSKKSNVGNTLISNFTLDLHNPHYENFVKILYAFNCSADYLLGLTDLHTEEKLYPVLPFSERLRALLKEHKLTQEQLKTGLPVSGSVLYKWLSGKNEPSTASLIRLAEFFDCSVDYLIGRIR